MLQCLVGEMRALFCQPPETNAAKLQTMKIFFENLFVLCIVGKQKKYARTIWDRKTENKIPQILRVPGSKN